MFCEKCGTQLNEGTKFCVQCGAMVDPNEPGLPADSQAPAAAYSAPPPNAGKTVCLKPLRVLSVIGIIWFPVCFASFLSVPDGAHVISYSFFAFGYAIALSIAAMVMGSKNNIPVLKPMGIVGLVLYSLSFLVNMGVGMAILYDSYYDGGAIAFFIFLILGLGYAFTYSIVVFVKAKISGR